MNGQRATALVHVLVVEDDDGDARLLVGRLQEASSRGAGRCYEVTRAGTCVEAIESATWQAPDIVLLDLGLPDVRGLDTFRRFRDAHPDVPVVVLTGMDDRELVDTAVRAGADDFLPKAAADTDALDRAIRYAIDRRELHRARDREASARSAAERRFRSLFDEHPDAVVEVDRTGRFRTGNVHAVSLLGPCERGASFLDRFAVGDREFVQELIRHAAGGGARSQPASASDDRGGTRLLLTAVPVVSEEPGSGAGAFVVLQDLSALSAALHQRQQLAHAVDTVDSGVIVLDARTWEVTFVNSAFTELVGLDRSDLVGATLQDLWPDLRPERVWALPPEPSESRAAAGYRARLLRPDGSVLVAGGIARWVPSAGRTLLVATVHDADERDRRDQATQQLAAIVRGADLAIVSVDARDRVLTWNAGAARLYGIAEGDAVGRRYAEVVGMPGDVRIRQLAKVLQGQVVTATGPRWGPGDAMMQVQATISPIIDDLGQVVGASSISRDVSDVEQAEQRLRDSERRFRLLAENASDVIFVRYLDPARPVYVSPAVEAMLGRSPAEFVADPDLPAELVHPADAARLAHARTRVDEHHDVTARMRHVDGSWRWLEYRLSPVIDEDGQLIGQQGVGRDMTERLAAERRLEEYAEQLERSNADLQRANMVRDELISVISHELRTPLTPISGFATLLRDRWGDRFDADQLKIVDVIGRNATRMIHLVDQLLDLSRLATGTLDANPQAVPARSVIETLVVDLGYAPGDVTIAGDRELEAMVDPRHLEQIVANLLENAFRYGRPPVELTVAAQGELVQLRVQDHGEGVPGEFVPRLFEKFAQASTGDRRTAVGLGVGLHLVRELVELNRGTVSYEATDRGACFVVELPVEAAPVADTTAPYRSSPEPVQRRRRPAPAAASHVAHEAPIPREVPSAARAVATVTQQQLTGVPDIAGVAHAATRLLLRAGSAEDAVGILLGVIERLGGDVVWAVDAGVDALPLDVSLGISDPLLPVVNPSSLERMALEAHLPGLVEDARHVVEINRHDARQQDLMSSLAHDMRSPVSGLTVAMSLIEETVGEDPGVAKLLETATRFAGRVLRLANDLLDVAKFEAGTYPFALAPARLERLAEQAVRLVSQTSGRDIQLSLESDLPVALVDESCQVRIVENLLSNAVKYSPPGTPIHVMVAPSGDGLEVRVHDAGPGLEPDEVAQLFRPFSRLERHRRAGIEGTGLGLHIARTLVEGQGGRLWVESGPDEGTTFGYTVRGDRFGVPSEG